MSYTKPRIDYSKTQFINEVMDKNHPDSSSNNTFNKNYFKDNLEAALKFYNIDKKYVKLHYDNKDSNYNIQAEIAQLLDFMFMNCKKSFLFDGRDNKDKITISEISEYNNQLINDIMNLKTIPDYVRALFQNNNTYRYNKNFSELSDMLVERLTHLFYLVFNVSCQGTEEIIINLIQQIDNWNKDIMKKFYNQSTQDYKQQKADTNKNCESNETDDFIMRLGDNTINNNHSLDTNITMVFDSLIRYEVNKPNNFLEKKTIAQINDSNSILKHFMSSIEINEEIYNIFYENKRSDVNNLRERYIEVLNQLIPERIELGNIINNNKIYENTYIDLNMELIKLFSKNKVSEKGEIIITDLIKQELLCYLGEFKTETDRKAFSHPYWHVLLDNVNIKNYYNRLDAFMSRKKVNYYSEYLTDTEHNYTELQMDKLLEELSKQIYDEIINNTAKYNTLILDDNVYNAIKENMNLFLGQIYLQVLQKEHTEFMQYKENKTQKKL